MSWYGDLAGIQSRGSQAERPGSLAGLAAARKQTLSQFFTHADVARLMWAIVAPAMDGLAGQRTASLLDNSLGSGRLFQYARPDRHSLYGCEVDREAVTQVAERAKQAGFVTGFRCAPMERIRFRGIDCGLINPPFSIALSSQDMEPLPCTHYGLHGANTAAISHAYALDQAMAATDIGVALLPTGFAEDQLLTHEWRGRFRALIRLPRWVFRDEGVSVDVSLLVYGRQATMAPVIRHDYSTRKALPAALAVPGLELPAERLGKPVVEGARADRRIELPVTGDTAVRVVHHGRRIHLKFRCGLVQAKVLNALLVGDVLPMYKHRYPEGVRFQGEGVFDLEVYLLQPDPQAAFDRFLAAIAAAGGTALPDPGLLGYFRKRIRQHRREATPLRHVVPARFSTPAAGTAVIARCRRDVPVNPARWGAPVLKQGRDYAFEVVDGEYRHCINGHRLSLAPKAFEAAFEAEAPAEGWVDDAPGRLVAWPQHHAQLRAEFLRRGLDQVASWTFQQDDVLELRMGRGGLLAAKMGCGKTRMGLALALMGGRHNALVVEPHLVDELVTEINELGLPAASWQVITEPGQCERLRTLNIISTHRLRMPVANGAGRRTFATRLRRRFSTVVCDEAQFLRHDTAQSRAVWQLSPRRRYAMTGTPLVNYVQDLLGPTMWSCGDGVALQPFGRRRPHLHPGLIKTMSACQRGHDVFRQRHAVFEWVTAQFEDSWRGGKRQVPKINALGELRSWLAPLIKRRITEEPEVARHFKRCKTIVHPPVLVPWDAPHLAHFLKVADHFAEFWRQDQRAEGRSHSSMVTMLARIGAVARAGTYPQHADPLFGGYQPVTAKQRAVIEQLVEWADEGRKSICYVENPGMLDLICAELAARGIQAVPFHGKMSIPKRTRRLNREFRYGPASVLVATLGTGQTGLNIWQASRVAFACRAWNAKTELQSIARTQRPQQTETVEVKFFHHPGSLDDYAAQLCDFKGDTATAALDFFDTEMVEEDFIHLDTMINDFVAAIGARKGLNPHEARKMLKEAV